MGVKLKDIVEPKKIDFKYLEGRAVSIDAFNTLYQFLSTIRQRDGRPLTDEHGNVTSHLSGILYRNSSMVEKDIKPIYVFDGKSSELKSDTQAKRREVRDEAEKIYKEALAQGDTEKARKFAMRSSKLSPEIIESSKKLLTLMGIPYVEAKGEGEAQAAYLVANGDAYAVASQDYDCLLFGAKRVVRNLAVNSNLGNLEFYLKELDVTREELIDMGILIGTDFCEGLKGVGAKTALKLAHNGQLKEKLAELQSQSTHDLDEVRQLFLNHNVNTDYKIKWEKPKQDKLIEFLCYEHGFSQDRVIKASDKLKKLNSSQGSLDAWF